MGMICYSATLMNNQYFSREGLEKLKRELDERMTITRPAIVQRIKDAKEQGDLAENAEFDAAKEDQSMNEGRIEELKAILENAIVISNGQAGTGIVVVGSTIKVQSKNGSQTFSIVGASESSPAQGFISNESPLGKTFLGHKKGDKVEVRTPKGVVEYTILEIK